MIKPCLALNEDFSRLATPLRLCYGANAIMTRVMICLQTQRGEWLDDDFFGIPWLKIGPATSDVEIEGLIKTQVLGLEGVLEVRDFSISRADIGMTIDMVITIKDENGPTLVKIGLLAEAGQYPKAWYDLLGIEF